MGITDLTSYFYDKTVLWKDIIIPEVFIQPHLVDLYDRYQKDYFIKIYHPSSSIVVQGFFLGYSNDDTYL
jgi:hypothetical protein